MIELFLLEYGIRHQALVLLMCCFGGKCVSEANYCRCIQQYNHWVTDIFSIHPCLLTLALYHRSINSCRSQGHIRLSTAVCTMPKLTQVTHEGLGVGGDGGAGRDPMGVFLRVISPGGGHLPQSVHHAASLKCYATKLGCMARTDDPRRSQLWERKLQACGNGHHPSLVPDEF